MHCDHDLHITVTDWPVPGRSSRVTLDDRIFSSRDAIEEHLVTRIGKGELKQDANDERVFTYTRETVAPPLLKQLACFLLNKSYG